MKSSQSMLIQFLRLSSGHFSNERASRLMKRIQADPRIEQRWQKLQSVVQEIRERDHDVSADEWEPADDWPGDVYESKIGAETLAAFIEETLDKEGVQRLERRAWASDELLYEIVDAFQFHCSPPTTDPVDSQLTSRLNQLAAWAVSDAETRLNGHDSLAAASEAKPTKVENSPFWTSRVFIAAAIVGSLLLIASVTLVIMNTDRQPTIADDPESDNVQNKQDNDLVQDDEPQIHNDEVPDVDPEPERVVDKEPDTVAVPDEVDPVVPPRIVNVPDSRNMDPDAIDRAFTWDNDPEPETNVEPDWVVPDLNWETVKGLLAYRDATSNHVTGYEYRAKPSESQSMVTLPGSWAEAELFGSESSLVLDGDTSVSLTARKEPGSSREFRRLNMRLNFGRAALKSLDKDMRLRLVAGPATWNVTTESDKTTLGVDWADGSPKLFVRTGQIALNGETVRRNQQINWTRNGNQVEKLTANVGWSTKSDDVVRLQSRDQLIKSDNLWRDLDELQLVGRQSDSEALVRLGWKLALYPDRMEEVLNGDDPQMRELAFQWLMSQSITHPRGRAVFQNTARRIGSRERLVAMYRAFHTLQSGHPPERAVAVHMVESLNDPQLFVRYAAATILTRAFNENPVRYRPDENAAIRARKAQQWAQRINALYDRLERAQQHRGDRSN